MQIAIVGLGKMGGNMVKRLLGGGHTVVAFDRDAKTVESLVKEGAKGATSLADVVKQLEAPRVVWVMVPSGDPTEGSINELSNLLSEGDVVIDGGNSNFHDDVRRSKMLAEKKIRFLDAGTSGGVWGLKLGYCLMVGGDEAAYKIALPALTTLAPPEGLGYFGTAGAGHFSKMVHNGIEYALMQSYAEGFELLAASEYKYDLEKLSHVWMQGSVIRSWLLELAESAFKKDPELKALKPYVDDTGEGRWTINEAIARAVPVPTIAAALFARFVSRQENSFSMRVLAALRNEFGGHAVKKA
jgi:6-phosphogluconate dehydrogenase